MGVCALTRGESPVPQTRRIRVNQLDIHDVKSPLSLKKYRRDFDRLERLSKNN
jgi:hypothetical protein